MTLGELLSSLGGLLGGIAAVYVLVRRKAIERYTHELDRIKYEHDVVFSRLHERRVGVIDDLYKKLVDAEIAFGSWVRPLQMAGEPSMDEKARLAAAAGEELQTTFLRNRIWLDETLCVRVEAVARKLYETYVDFTTYPANDPRMPASTWQEVWEGLDKDVARLRKEIEAEFRRLLGVASSPAVPR